jgi:hypothetical protein
LAGCVSKQGTWKHDPKNYNENPEPLCHPLESMIISETCDLDKLSRNQKSELTPYLMGIFQEILKNYDAPKADGSEYYGQLTFCTSREGNVEQVELFQPSGYKHLDDAFVVAVSNLSTQSIPENPCVQNHEYFKKKTLYFDHTDLAN